MVWANHTNYFCLGNLVVQSAGGKRGPRSQVNGTVIGTVRRQRQVFTLAKNFTEVMIFGWHSGVPTLEFGGGGGCSAGEGETAPSAGAKADLRQTA